jgi:hypothetical protein
MKAIRQSLLVVGFSLVATGCATTATEPPAHVAQCHTNDGLLVNSPDCITTHNNVVMEREKTRAARRSRLEHGGGRLNR